MPVKEKYYVHSAHIYNRTSHFINLKIFYCGENQHHEHAIICMNKLEPNGGHFFAETHAYANAHLIVDKHIYKIQADINDGNTLELKWPYQGLVEKHEKEWQFDIEEGGIKSINPRL
ncbi:unnamed protein product [Rotaria socialis]|uniref:Uncharacterized protein n=1 Tax=Rotaria socialis TaxID=392032 RepID=A0A821N960_9BILA|nr:unnamed protein product [Rotaria socialis]CAF3370087.1 unnamed protein product [Rotaria socialis]CAF3401486.1 unnamed protein product [Rotaria socialis]CAF3511065.1 unnamed protein product [Rotaria socialis]CAF3713248.1 unnamed protein product [Rotaria socialis]